MQWYEEVFQTLLIGITNGAIISLVALGYTLVYGIIELINFAHGDVFMIGTMVSLTILTVIPPILGVRQAFQLQPAQIALLLIVCLFASAAVCALLNVVIERLAYRRLRNAPRLAPLISAIGVSFILVNIGLVWKGASPVNFPNLLPPVDILHDVFGVDTLVQFRLKDLFVLILAVPLMIALQMFVQRTRLGKAMRATAQDRQAASMMGIDINLTIALTFLLGGALAGSAGLIYGLYNNSAWFFQGFRAGLYAFTAAVMGGIGNIQGAFMGGMLIGIIAAISDRIIDPKWTEAVVFALLVLILIFKPRGLLGEETTERA
jgi:branched-chain amino acid transport system permease protein